MTEQVLDEHGGTRRRKVFALNEFQGHRYFEIEEFFLNRGSHEWRKKKGVTFNKDAYRVLRETINRSDEKIMDWIGVGYVPEDVARYEEVQEMAVHDNRYAAGDLEVSTYREHRDPCFFHVEHEGQMDNVLLNDAHPMSTVLQSHDDRVKLIIATILAAYHRARSMLADAPAYDPHTLFTHLEQDWGKYLADAIRSSAED